MPSGGFRMTHLEVPDLRSPVELNRIGQGSVVAHSDNFSFVTVHEDMVPKTLDTHLPGATVSNVHTSEISVPTLHTQNLGATSLHTGGVPNLSANTTHLADGLHTSVPSLHIAEMTAPNLHTVNLGGAGIRPVIGHEATNLFSIAHAKIENADVHGLTVGQSSDGVSLVPQQEMFARS